MNPSAPIGGDRCPLSREKSRNSRPGVVHEIPCPKNDPKKTVEVRRNSHVLRLFYVRERCGGNFIPDDEKKIVFQATALALKTAAYSFRGQRDFKHRTEEICRKASKNF